MTREEHREAYEAHSRAARGLFAMLDVNRDVRRDGDSVTSSKAVASYSKLVEQYHDELTAASAHLALAMLLDEVDAR